MRERVGERGRGGSALWWAALQQVGGVGAGRALRLARIFGSAEAALAAPEAELIARGRLTPVQAAGIKHVAGSLEAVRRALAKWRRCGIHAVAMGEAGYPDSLLDLRTPPPLLYIKGELRRDDSRAVAIVGTREPTPGAELVAAHLARGLAERGFTIVSGLARGIDTAGHNGALESHRGRTIAVLGSGLLRIYPPENAALAERIGTRGCALAEVAPDTEVDRRLLLARDRLQAALSRAVLVIQAHPECGSVVTARHAARCGRLLLGVPWDEPPFREGWQRLAKMGAQPVDLTTDLDELAAAIGASRPRHTQRPLL